MNEQSKANEWEFWDYDASALSASHYSSNGKPKTEEGSYVEDAPKRSHILPSQIEVDSSRYDEDDVDEAWREFDSYENILHSASISDQKHAEEAQQVMSDSKPRAPVKIQATTKSTSTQGGPKKSLDSGKEKSRSPGLNDVKSNCKGARAA